MHTVQELTPGSQLSLAELGFESLSRLKALFPLTHPAWKLEAGRWASISPSGSHHVSFYVPHL